MFNERQKRILHAIIVDYISTAEPVGSRTIARKYNLGVSPATIRNEMSELEEAGYLEQPHTSAGRIPSDLGYRFYVDALMEPVLLDDLKQAQIRVGLSQRGQELATLMHQAAKLLSNLTSYTSVVLGPVRSKRVFKNLALVGVDDYHLLMVLVTEPNFIENSLVELTEAIDPGTLANLATSITGILQGQSLGQFSPTLHQQLKTVVSRKDLYAELMQLLFRAQEPQGGQVIIEGTTHLLEQPEFMDLNKVKAFLRAVEGKELLLNILGEEAVSSGLRVRIGKENGVGEFQDCSLVTATYEFNGEVLGTLGVFGPTRLDYANTTAAVSIFSQILSEMLEEML